MDLESLGAREPQTWETPWGRARSLNREEMRAVQERRRPITWAERWVIARDWHEAKGADPGEAALLASADVLRERAATAHERVACPTCGVPRGERCVRKGTSRVDAVFAARLKHSHEARLRADGIQPR